MGRSIKLQGISVENKTCALRDTLVKMLSRRGVFVEPTAIETIMMRTNDPWTIAVITLAGGRTYYGAAHRMQSDAYSSTKGEMLSLSRAADELSRMHIIDDIESVHISCTGSFHYVISTF